jgi:hypothetical protein
MRPIADGFSPGALLGISPVDQAASLSVLVVLPAESMAQKDSDRSGRSYIEMGRFYRGRFRFPANSCVSAKTILKSGLTAAYMSQVAEL